MNIHGAYMDIFGHIWTYTNIFKHIRTYINIYEHIWTYIMNIYGHIPALGGWTSLPAALRRPQKNDAPGFFEHVYCQFSHILSIVGLPGFVFLQKMGILFK